MLPVDGACRPAMQSTQRSDGTPTTATPIEALPASQAVHAVAARPEYSPAVQSRHEAPPADDWPALHESRRSALIQGSQNIIMLRNGSRALEPEENARSTIVQADTWRFDTRAVDAADPHSVGAGAGWAGRAHLKQNHDGRNKMDFFRENRSCKQHR